MSAQNPSGAGAPPPMGGGTAPANESLTTPKRRRSGQVSTTVAVVIAVVLLGAGLGGGYILATELKTSSSSTVDITETGSSLLYPLLKYYWGPNYTAYDSKVVLSTASTGSGTGQTDAEDADVNIGASDGYLTTAASYNLLNIPVAFSAQLIYYNLPGFTGHLNLNGTILGDIYNGTITTWNNPLIAAANPTLASKLPSDTIVPLVRKDSSGDTFLFSSLCQMSLKNWTFGVGTTAFAGTSWTSETGNSGMVSGLNSTPYSIAYVGISYEASAAAEPNHLQYAALGDNQSLSASGGTDTANYILPGATNISNDANLALQHLNFASDGLQLSLILGGSYAGPTTLTPGAGGTNSPSNAPAYPLVNFEYNIVKTAPVSASGSVVTSTTLAATVAFLEWAVSHGNFAATGGPSVWIDAVNFVPLTPEVIGYVLEDLAQIQP